METPVLAVRGVKDSGPGLPQPESLARLSAPNRESSRVQYHSPQACPGHGATRLVRPVSRPLRDAAPGCLQVGPELSMPYETRRNLQAPIRSSCRTARFMQRSPRRGCVVKPLACRQGLCYVLGQGICPHAFSGTTHLVVAHLFLGTVLGTVAAIFMFFQVGLLWALVAYVVVGSTAMLTSAAARWLCRSRAQGSEDTAPGSHGIIHPAQAAKTLRTDPPRCGEADRDRRAAKESGHIQGRIPDRRMQRTSADREAAKGR